jgi:hypothetical protein
MSARVSAFRRFQQPASVASPTDVAARRSRLDHESGAGPLGLDSHRLPAPGDHRGNALVNVGADFFTAAELAALKLPGLPDRREHVSRLASKQGWPHRPREGRGGGREFPLASLPPPARREIINRRLQAAALKATGGTDKEIAPLPVVANLKSRQAERLAARTLLLDHYTKFRGDRSDRQALDAFVVAFDDGSIDVPEWAQPLLPRLSRRTLESWLAARRAGRHQDLAGRWAGGRKSIFDVSRELADFILGCHIEQPALSIKGLQKLLGEKFPHGVADRAGILLPLPSQTAITRFLSAWKAEARNAATLSALNDPDGYKSRYRFAVGNASGGIDRPNQRWQIDASPSDVQCLDGRFSIYVVIDVFSRRMMALVTRTPRTAASLLLVARAIALWGVPEVLVTDNGTDFTSRHFMRTAYAAGQWKRIHRTKKALPYLVYDTRGDSKVRALHRRWDKVCLPVDHEWWVTHFPPCDWKCRCGVRQLTAGMVKRQGLRVWDEPPDDGPPRKFVNNRTGETTMVPRGVHPSFAYNPGEQSSYPDPARYTGKALADAAARLAVRNDAFTDLIAGQNAKRAAPVGWIDDAISEALDVVVKRVDLSSDTMAKQIVRYADLTLPEYQQLPDLFSSGLVVQDDKNTINLFGLLRDADGNSRLYTATAKRTGDGRAVFLTSFHRARPSQLQQALDGDIVRDAAELRSASFAADGTVTVG